MTGELINAIKQIAVDANEANDPVRLMFGVITGTEPLEVTIGQRLIIDSTRLFLCSAVIDKDGEETFDMNTEISGSGGESHSHRIYGKKKVVFNNRLKIGDKVIILRMQGGQRFLILDRVVE